MDIFDHQMHVCEESKKYIDMFIIFHDILYMHTVLMHIDGGYVTFLHDA